MSGANSRGDSRMACVSAAPDVLPAALGALHLGVAAGSLAGWAWAWARLQVLPTAADVLVEGLLPLATAAALWFN